MSEGLPGSPGPTLQRIYDELEPDERESVMIRLFDGSSAERLALVLRRHGHAVSASTIRTYRRSLQETA
ncbi:hypothetical protein BLA24_26015 [Streptomyces cinnamoneus]|uniref:Uncharacterized protein n=1 Tax=Streptomyces cinnamoneus TaxID=53446 RepID=A0A2G1XE61_STRCJ|nr:hypothetical protein [Streptomyces cinnamoneus]PHQ49495.1 hypothetical protein BLA24_26015 [Streptomyces cinnamoneus]PPT14854.1 hypothetical protein CYQ11_20050 [Streptomyces cinnamoneus]